MAELDGSEPQPRPFVRVVSQRLEDGIVLAAVGEIDIATAPIVERELVRAAESHRLVVLDLSHVSFMDSTGLRMMIAADRRMSERDGQLVVVDGPGQVHRLLELTGFVDRLQLIGDLGELERCSRT